MRSALRVLFLLLIPVGAFARDVFLPIAGNPRTFRTDVSLFNSSSNPLTVTATFLPAGQDNRAATGIQMSVAPRQMLVLEDIVRTRFGRVDGTAVGAIKFTTAGSNDALVVAGRIYANSMAGTVGQFVPPLEASDAIQNGALVQLKATGEIGAFGTFRTNLGFTNPNSTAATVTIRLFDKNNNPVGAPISRTIPAMSVDYPTRTDRTLQLPASAADFSDAVATFESNVPIFGFASVVDNGSSDAFLTIARRSGSGGAVDVFLPITGNPRIFRTDVTLFNASTTPMTVTATFLPAVGTDAAATEKTISVPARQALMLPDVMRKTFGISDSTALGAIRFSTTSGNDDLIVTSRIYSRTQSGTVGQFVPGMRLSNAQQKGVLLQLKATGESGTGTFRTNVGLMNPNSTPATVTIRLYDKNNAVVGGPITRTIPPMSVDFPHDSASPLRISAAAGDFSNAWIGFESNVPIFGFGSVIENGTSDPILVIAGRDSGSDGTPQPSAKTFNVTAKQFDFVIAEGAMRVSVGDRVVINITSTDVTHGFGMERYVPSEIELPRNQLKTIEFIANEEGTFQYFCTRSTCGSGHFAMTGEFVVGKGGDGGGPGYKQ